MLYQADIGSESFQSQIFYGISEMKFKKRLFVLFLYFKSKINVHLEI